MVSTRARGSAKSKTTKTSKRGSAATSPKRGATTKSSKNGATANKAPGKKRPASKTVAVKQGAAKKAGTKATAKKGATRVAGKAPTKKVAKTGPAAKKAALKKATAKAATRKAPAKKAATRQAPAPTSNGARASDRSRRHIPVPLPTPPGARPSPFTTARFAMPAAARASDTAAALARAALTPRAERLEKQHSPLSAETVLDTPAARALAEKIDKRAALEALDFDETPAPVAEPPPMPDAVEDPMISRWTERGEDLRRKLTILGADKYEYRADLKDGRFVWLSDDGAVRVEARAQVLCTWMRPTSVVIMAWADPLMHGVGVARVDGMSAEHDNMDEAAAWYLAMLAADSCGAEYIYRVPTPHASYFLALGGLKPAADAIPFTPGTPVGLVLRGLFETRHAVASRAEPSDVIRDRLSKVGSALTYQAEYAYRGTDWVARLQRTGKTLTTLASRLARPTFSAIAAGRPADEWLGAEVATELVDAITLLEEEWAAFA